MTKKPKHDDWGFDPRDGGKIGKQHAPKWRPVSKQVRKAMRGKLGSSPFYPGARPKRSSP